MPSAAAPGTCNHRLGCTPRRRTAHSRTQTAAGNEPHASRPGQHAALTTIIQLSDWLYDNLKTQINICMWYCGFHCYNPIVSHRLIFSGLVICNMFFSKLHIMRKAMRSRGTTHGHNTAIKLYALSACLRRPGPTWHNNHLCPGQASPSPKKTQARAHTHTHTHTHIPLSPTTHLYRTHIS